MSKKSKKSPKNRFGKLGIDDWNMGDFDSLHELDGLIITNVIHTTNFKDTSKPADNDITASYFYKIPIPKPSAIKEYLDKFVIGQEEAKKAISLALVNHLYRLKHNTTILKNYESEKLDKQNLLLLGDSGTGKTYIIKLACEFLGLPFITIDATKYSGTGYVGGDIDDIPTLLHNLPHSNRDLIKGGIIFIDEIDKVARTTSERKDTVNTLQVQYGFLKLVEGGMCGKGNIDTSEMLFVFAGAFDGLVGTKKTHTRSSYGFSTSNSLVDAGFEDEKRVQEEDILKYGIIPELLGRIGKFIQLDQLSYDDYMNILLKTERSPLSQFQKMFQLRGKKFPLQDRDYDEIVLKARQSKLGVRALARELEMRLRDELYE